VAGTRLAGGGISNPLVPPDERPLSGPEPSDPTAVPEIVLSARAAVECDLGRVGRFGILASVPTPAFPAESTRSAALNASHYARRVYSLPRGAGHPRSTITDDGRSFHWPKRVSQWAVLTLWRRGWMLRRIGAASWIVDSGERRLLVLVGAPGEAGRKHRKGCLIALPSLPLRVMPFWPALTTLGHRPWRLGGTARATLFSGARTPAPAAVACTPS